MPALVGARPSASTDSIELALVDFVAGDEVPGTILRVGEAAFASGFARSVRRRREWDNHVFLGQRQSLVRP